MKMTFRADHFKFKCFRLCLHSLFLHHTSSKFTFMSEFIIIQVGQCGNQIGSCFIPQILQEYGHPATTNGSLQKDISSFFNVKRNHGNDLFKAKARVICIDMEESVVSRFKIGKFKDLYDKKCIITNHPGSGNNWAEGYWTHGPDFEGQILKTVQYLVEQCDGLHGFLFIFSMGGGTGSGLGTYILKLLADNYPAVERFVAAVYPIGTEDVITCSYNMAFATQELINNATCIFPVENRALLDIVNKQSDIYKNEQHSSGKPEGKPFEDMNNIVVNMLLHLTSGSRFPGCMNMDMNEINTNMVPFPLLKFLSSGFSPFAITKNTNGSKQFKNEVFLSACNRRNQLLKLDPLDSTHVMFSTTLIGRGSYTLDDMRGYVEKLRIKTKFAPWSQKAIKVGLCDVAPAGSDVAMFGLFNTTSMSSLFETIHSQFMKLYQRKAHVHHYTNVSGFDINNFADCKESISNILDLYKHTNDTTPIYEPPPDI